jgi:alpha-D-ribose 1-methylphosphonate 5-triphosphate synthase subunit PhnG
MLQARLLVPVQEHLQALKLQRQQRAQSTKVDFLTVAREAGAGDEEEA